MNKFRLKALTAACALALLGSVPGPAAAAPGDTWTFTTCGTSGRTGPTQGACDAAYAATTLNGAVTVAAGIQAWVVPATATYRIQALGAAGGTQTFGGPASAGGLGASIQGDISLVAGETIYFLVGQKGEDTRVSTEDNAAPGGGGGTFVYRAASDPAPLIAAGGGGAGSSCTAIPNPALRNANATADGNPSGSGPNGGASGNGGTNNVFPDDYSYWAGGGTGWLTDGTGGDNLTDYDYTAGDSGAEGGRTPQNGALGGIRWNDGNDEGGDGGFGGGGGGGSDNMGTGGGGGYSGGGGGGGAPIDINGENCNNAPGGGGGSFNGGANPVNTAAFNAGDGQITVTELGAGGGATPVPALSNWSLAVLASLLALVGVYVRRRV